MTHLLKTEISIFHLRRSIVFSFHRAAGIQTVWRAHHTMPIDARGRLNEISRMEVGHSSQWKRVSSTDDQLCVIESEGFRLIRQVFVVSNGLLLSRFGAFRWMFWLKIAKVTPRSFDLASTFYIRVFSWNELKPLKSTTTSWRTAGQISLWS